MEPKGCTCVAMTSYNLEAAQVISLEAYLSHVPTFTGHTCHLPVHDR